MTKDAVKKYTKQLGVGGMILHYISRFLTKAEMQIIGKMTRRFGKVKKNRMVFKNREMMDYTCLLYTSPSPRDASKSRMPSSA